MSEVTVDQALRAFEVVSRMLRQEYPADLTLSEIVATWGPDLSAEDRLAVQVSDEATRTPQRPA